MTAVPPAAEIMTAGKGMTAGVAANMCAGTDMSAAAAMGRGHSATGQRHRAETNGESESDDRS